MQEKNLNIYQKLVQVRKEVKYVQKSGNGYNFQYATEPQILGAIRSKMDELNLFLEVNMDALEPVVCMVIQNKALCKVDGLKATFSFTWTNGDQPDQTITKKMIMQDIEQGIETVGGLLTYANRYFLYKFFSVPTDKDDPDAFNNKIEKTFHSTPDEPVQKAAPLQPLALLKDVLEIENAIEAMITPADPGYKKRALERLQIESFSRMTQYQVEIMRTNIANKIIEINQQKDQKTI
jgi:hypothetical protein